MADTQRTRAAIVALLADNISGDISAQDVRDMFESDKQSEGECYVSAAAATTPAGSYLKALGTTTFVGGTNFDDDGGTSNRLKYIGVEPVHADIVCAFSMTCGGNLKVLGVGIAKNGTFITASEIQRKIGTGTDIGAGACQASVSLSNGDYVEVFVNNHTDNATITLDFMNLHITACTE